MNPGEKTERGARSPGIRPSGAAYHVPVMVREVLSFLAVRPGGFWVDATVGGGGHAERILEVSSPDGFLLGIDRDEAAICEASRRLAAFSGRFSLVLGNFREIDGIVQRAGAGHEGFAGPDGILFDLGVSLRQLEDATRGFSYKVDMPLDMRMGPDARLSARDIVAEWSRDELTRILRDYGEERWASRIAEFIVRERERNPIETTGQLVEVIKEAIPEGARRTGSHPAKRVFQAIRIAVNDELRALEEGLARALECLRPGGRMVVISYHSLEDRIVKTFFARNARGCTCPPDLPVCVCGNRPTLRVITRKPVLPGDDEVENNPRARSARLRACEKF